MKLAKKSIISSIGLVLLIVGILGWQKYSFEIDDNPLNVSILEPEDFDWQQIQDRGTIRLITRYNSVSYFLHNGVAHGFEYDFLKAFADENNLVLEVVIVSENQNPIDLLNSGEGDIIAANYTVTNQRLLYHDFSHPYNRVSPHIIIKSSKMGTITQLDDLKGLTISVRKGSSYYSRLKELEEQGYPIKINALSEDWDTEAILLNVSKGEFDATAADDNLFYAANTYINGISLGPAIASTDSVAYGIRANAPNLKQRLNDFVSRNYRMGSNGIQKRSALLNILLKRYFEDDLRMIDYKNSSISAKYEGILSPYDQLIRPIADSLEIDWKLVVSVVAQESKFNPLAKSWAGAVGLMQVNQRFSVFSEDELYDPQTNLLAGIQILRTNLKHYQYLDEKNQWALALATYNAGIGHVTDARKIVIEHGKDPNEWVNVEDALLKLMKRKYYKDAQYGFCRGIETVTYVKEVMDRYEMYNTIYAIAERTERKIPRFAMGLQQALN